MLSFSYEWEKLILLKKISKKFVQLSLVVITAFTLIGFSASNTIFQAEEIGKLKPHIVVQEGVN